MQTTTPAKGVREGSAQKREAILAAARELFLADGVERTSVDAIAASAGVSKRTVYDYYGDKRNLLLAVVEQAVDALGAAVTAAIDANLRGDIEIESALTRFAQDITATALGSSDYIALVRLLSTESVNLPELWDKHWNVGEPEDAVAERFAEFDRRGLLVTPDPRLAADHFVALTVSSFASTLGRPIERDEQQTQHLIVEGVRAFLRAYGA
ncbi:TetR/AcrR family transcriptional regulator [Leifsonia sp. WHRI 6310E]|uniref:TetR/AcrR family transcriptional regulator n=1 Tax=Leifsonia sp. WHRI 6310E TaxID=3162562 RepID=UPI0032EEEAEB